NSSEFIITLFASAKIGAVFNPINYRLTEYDLQFILKDANSKVLVYETELEETVQSAIRLGVTIDHFIHADRKNYKNDLYFYDLLNNDQIENLNLDITEDDIYIMMYTSGTTGNTKGVVHRHRSIVHHSFLMENCMGITANDIGLSVAPLNHTAELHTSFKPRVHVGATNIILRAFDAKKTLKTIE